MKRPRRPIVRNNLLRFELIRKGLIVPYHNVPEWLLAKGFTVAAEAAAAARGRPLRRNGK